MKDVTGDYSHKAKLGYFQATPAAFGSIAQSFKTGWMRGFWIGPVVIVWYKPGQDHSRKPGAR